MGKSKIDICNIALATLGAEAIRSFSEGNIRAQMCDVVFDVTRDYLLTKFDWPFARAYSVLQPVDMTVKAYPEGVYAYALPADCLAPRDIHPEGSRHWWKIAGKELQCGTPQDDPNVIVGLYYTTREIDTYMYSSAFVNLLALAIAARLCMPITQDTDMAEIIHGQFTRERAEAWESDANVGNEYRRADDRHDDDTFVRANTWLMTD